MKDHTYHCRFCGTGLTHKFVDLGMSPLANSNIKPSQLSQAEAFYPLDVYVCTSCFLVQLAEYESPANIFSDYLYFSSYSESWLRHAKRYTDDMQSRFGLNSSNLVVEIASNDGYLLQYFKEKSIPVLGVEPAANVAEVAVAKGIPSVVKFFGVETAKSLAAEGKSADLLLGNNVLAHVPDINDFVGGMKVLLKDTGIITMEFPHLLQLVEHNQFDTIYHEHYSYLSATAVSKVFAAHGLRLFDVEELPTHGGSLRIYACHDGNANRPQEARLNDLLAREQAVGVQDLAYYDSFTEKVKRTKRDVLKFLIATKEAGKTIVGYGAPAKGNTLLNYCGVRTDFLDYTVDLSPHKQGLYLPGVHIPIFAPERIRETKPDYVMILPWNLKDEIMQQMAYIRDWGGKFITAIPEVQVH